MIVSGGYSPNRTLLDVDPRHSENAPVETTAEPLISLQSAWDHVASEVWPGPIEIVPVARVHGRVLAQSVLATADYPSFDKAMMDGYSVQAASTAGAPCVLRVVGELRAGRATEAKLNPGDAMRINTGAALPLGADAVIPVEETASGGNGSVRINRAATPGRCVSRRGSIRRVGQRVLSASARIRSAQLAALATAGVPTAAVYRMPSAAIVVTGDELVSLGSAPAEGQIIDSNGPMLAAMASECGAHVVSSSAACDEECDLREKLADAMRAAEGGVVLAVGGMSKGTRDLVPAVARELGVRWVFQGVNLRPGKPTGFGIGPQAQFIFGLPGNPVSSAVSFLLFVQLALERLVGFDRKSPAMFRARLSQQVAAGKDARPTFLPAAVTLDGGQSVVRPTIWRGSSDPFGPADANCYVYHVDATRALEAGQFVDVLPVPGLLDQWSSVGGGEV